MNQTLNITTMVVSSILLCACATPTVVQSVQPGDYGLSCGQLQNDYSTAVRLRAEADNEKSVTGGNVLRLLLFWPAILGTASNANEAIAAADTRMVNLANIMNQKGCAIPAPASQTTTPIFSPPVEVVSTQQSADAQLIELKRLFDAGLITSEVYAEKQKDVLAGSTK